MIDTTFLAAVEGATSGTLPLGDLINTANKLAEAGRSDLARQLYKIWIACNRDDPQTYVAYFNCGCLESQADDPAAIASLESAIAVNPDFMPAYINLGGLLERAGKADKAVELWSVGLGRLATVTGPSFNYKIATLKQMARLLGERQQPEASETALRECLSLNPEQRDVLEQFTAIRLVQCKWPVAAPIEGLDRAALVSNIHPLSMAAYTDDPLLQLAAATRYTDQSVKDPPGAADTDRRDAPIELSNRRLRVGYISSDLREHAVGYLMAEVFELHDRGKVEVFAYYCGIPGEDALKTRTKRAVEHWVDIRDLSDDAAAQRIAEDGIDILVDVNGHTRDARTGVFARRPAPIQVNWLGYPGTMGSAYHHYMIADEWIATPGFEVYCSEKVVRLPCYQPNDRKRVVAPERPSRAEAGLPDDAFVFCCFNGAQKITRFAFERWIQILLRTPGSVLWLLASTEETHERLRNYAESQGVGRERIVFAPKQPNPMHLARYPLADLFLDTSPYGAHTTASDALWMGVPVLTLSGRSFAARVCGSLVRSAGLPDLVCDTPEDFVDRAVALATDPAAVGRLKARLEVGRTTCDLFNMEKLVGCLEELYRGMVADYWRGELPRPNLDNLAAYFEAGVALDHEGVEMLAVPDYHGIYRDWLAGRHRNRPLPADPRLWTVAEIAAREPAAPVPRLSRAVGD